MMIQNIKGDLVCKIITQIVYYKVIHCIKRLKKKKIMIISRHDETTLICVKHNFNKLGIKRNFLKPYEMLYFVIFSDETLQGFF